VACGTNRLPHLPHPLHITGYGGRIRRPPGIGPASQTSDRWSARDRADRESSQSLMFLRLSLAISAFALMASVALAAPKPSTPKECPVTEHSLDAIEAAIAKAASCEESMDTFQACAYVASGDVPLGQAVIGKCEGDFLDKLNARQKRAYEQEVERCWRKYRREGGTMYRSFEAMCAAGVAQAYSRRFMRTGGAKQHK
jgi:hypothetical protein